MKASALHAAAYAGRTEAARLLIQYNVEVDKQGPYNGYTALHDAIWQNHVETAKVIIDAGANLGLKNNAGQTPLEFARTRGQKELVALLEQKLGKS
jgi:ankyrin repeat protein